MLKTRKYQEEALDTIEADLLTDDNALLQAATGAGKTVIFSHLIERYHTKFKSFRTLILTRQKELVEQSFDKIKAVYPEGVDKIGICCSSVSAKKQVKKPILIATPQSYSKLVQFCDPFNLIIIDEVHTLPPISKTSQYKDIIDIIRSKRPTARLLGFTATPYRLNHGYIFGSECKESADNWFSRLNFSISMKQLQGEGYLCPIRYKANATARKELSCVKKTAGDYNEGELSKVMICHIDSVLTSIEKHAQEREHIVIFCVTIEHAKKVSELLNASGIECESVHSKMSKKERNRILADFQSGRLRACCNVGVLTTGFDYPEIDCIVLARPTLSASLFVQMVGRGARIAEGKDDCIVLDLSDNYARHGHPSDPYVNTYKVRTRTKTIEEMEKDDSAYGDGKVCPKCSEIVSASKEVCTECGHFFAQVIKDVELVDVDEREENKPFWIDIKRVKVELYTSSKKNEMLRVLFFENEKDWIVFGVEIANESHAEYLNFSHDYLAWRAAQKWKMLTGRFRKFSSNLEAFEKRYEIESFTGSIEVRKKGKYYELLNARREKND
jgi:DNA repair protein RadD